MEMVLVGYILVGFAPRGCNESDKTQVANHNHTRIESTS